MFEQNLFYSRNWLCYKILLCSERTWEEFFSYWEVHKLTLSSCAFVFLHLPLSELIEEEHLWWILQATFSHHNRAEPAFTVWGFSIPSMEDLLPAHVQSICPNASLCALHQRWQRVCCSLVWFWDCWPRSQFGAEGGYWHHKAYMGPQDQERDRQQGNKLENRLRHADVSALDG